MHPTSTPPGSHLQISTHPADHYKDTTDRLERRRLQAEAVRACAPNVLTYVRGALPRFAQDHVEEAVQVGLIGVLAALEKYDPSQAGDDRGAVFWKFAAEHVRDEVREWTDRGVYWRTAAGRGKSPLREVGELVADAEGAATLPSDRPKGAQ